MRLLPFTAFALLLVLGLSWGKPGYAKDKKKQKKEEAAAVLRARFQAPIDGLRQLLSTRGGDDGVLKALRGKNGRGLSFALEGLFRIYEDHYPDTMSGLRAKAKELEDRMGWYIDSEDHLDYAKTVGITKRSDPVLYAYLVGSRDENRNQFLEFLHDNGWLPSLKHPDQPSILSTIEQQLDQTHWDTWEEDHDFVVKSLRKEIDKHLIEPTYDMHVLDSGMHKFRRELRWLLVEAQALHGNVVLDDRPVPKEFRDIFSDPVTQSKFSKISDREDQDFHIFFPRAYYLMLTKAVSDLGRAKDVGEAIEEWLSDALYKSGAARSRETARRRAETLAKRHPDYVDRLALANQAYRDIKGGNLLRNLRDDLESQRDLSKKQCRLLYGDCAD